MNYGANGYCSKRRSIKSAYVVQCVDYIHKKKDVVSREEIKEKFDLRSNQIKVLNRWLKKAEENGEIVYVGVEVIGTLRDSYWLSAKVFDEDGFDKVKMKTTGQIRKVFIENGLSEKNIEFCKQFVGKM